MKRLCMLLVLLLLAQSVAGLAEARVTETYSADVALTLGKDPMGSLQEETILRLRSAEEGGRLSLLVDTPWNQALTLHVDREKGLFLRDEASGLWSQLSLKGSPLSGERLQELAQGLSEDATLLYHLVLGLMEEDGLKQELELLYAKLQGLGSGTLALSTTEITQALKQLVDRAQWQLEGLSEAAHGLLSPFVELGERAVRSTLTDRLFNIMFRLQRIPAFSLHYALDTTRPWLVLAGDLFSLKLNGQMSDTGDFDFSAKLLPRYEGEMILDGSVSRDGTMVLDATSDWMDAAFRLTAWRDGIGASATLLLTSKSDRDHRSNRYAMDIHQTADTYTFVVRETSEDYYASSKQLLTISRTEDGFKLLADLPALGVYAKAKVELPWDGQRFYLESEGYAEGRPFSLGIVEQSVEGSVVEGPPDGELPLLEVETVLRDYFSLAL